MISLTSELMDGKGGHARGWLFFDAECRFCTRFARWIAPSLRQRGLGLAPMQDARVSALLGMTQTELLREMRLVLSDGRRFGGGVVWMGLGEELWWAGPLAWMAQLRGARRWMQSWYRWVAARRGCASAVCAVMPHKSF